MIPFNIPSLAGNEERYVLEAMRSSKISGDGEYSQRCQRWFEKKTGCKRALFAPSCTHALEMAAILIDIHPDDEVIMPSYTFVSTANAFALRGAKIVFVDIHPDTMNIDETLIEAAITPKTKAIVPVHYAGVGCKMDMIMDIAKRYSLVVIEDAAQGMMSKYKERALGTVGHLGAYSFHETKNYTSGGEGGLLLINDEKFIQQAEIIREKGTNRSQFFRGMVDKYTWVDLGSSYLPSELQAAYLWGQLELADEINVNRLTTWKNYFSDLVHLQQAGKIELPCIPTECEHNGHIFYLKCNNLEERTAFLASMINSDILAVFHYVPLHSSPAGQRLSRFHGKDDYTTKESERIARLPIWYGMERGVQQRVIQAVQDFFA